MPGPNLFDFVLKLFTLGFVFLVYFLIFIGLITDEDPTLFFHAIMLASLWYGYNDTIKEQLYDILKDIHYVFEVQRREFMAFLNSK